MLAWNHSYCVLDAHSRYILFSLNIIVLRSAVNVLYNTRLDYIEKRYSRRLWVSDVLSR